MVPILPYLQSWNNALYEVSHFGGESVIPQEGRGCQLELFNGERKQDLLPKKGGRIGRDSTREELREGKSVDFLLTLY
jgi:hypothetical protein